MPDTDTAPVEPWRAVWRASAPLLPTAGLLALRQALRDDDPRLIQGATTEPPPLSYGYACPCEGACLWGFVAWQGGMAGEGCVNEVQSAFAAICHAADQAGEGCGWCAKLLNWWDDTPRSVAIAALLPEVESALSARDLAGTLAWPGAALHGGRLS